MSTLQFEKNPKLIIKITVATVKVGRIKPNSCYLVKARLSLITQVFMTTVVPWAQRAVTGDMNLRL